MDMSKLLTTHPETSMEEITVGEVLRWMEKFEMLTSKGAKVVHIKHLLQLAVSKAEKRMIEEIRKSVISISGTGKGKPTILTFYIKNWKKLLNHSKQK